jgi:chromosome segregation ATPase
MILDQDIEKLKKAFATKEDLKIYATKEDLKTYATQDSLNRLEQKVDGIQEELGDLKIEVGELHDKIDSIDNKIDGLAGLIHASLEEHGAGAVHLARHDRQIKALAQGAGMLLPD